MRLTTLAAAALCLLPVCAIAQTLPDTARTIIVLDGSGSMWGQIDGRPKLEIAREVLGQVLADIPADRELGLMAYGHRRRGDCGDIELVVPPAPGTAGQIIAAANAMRFQGRTPLTDAVRMAARELNFTENPATVVLITDGIETCQADPCALGRELEAAGVGFTAHVVGFDMTAEEGAQVACLAQETGGQYLLADDAAGLASALAAAVAGAPATVAQAQPPAPPAPPPAAADPLPPASLQAPAEVAALERFSVAVTGPLNPGDYLDVVYDGQTRLTDLLYYVMLADGLPATMTAPVEPGDYVIRYIEDPGGRAPRVLATAPLSVAPAAYGLQAAGTVMAGAQLRVEWQAAWNEGDWIDLAPAGSTDPNTTVTWIGVNPDGTPVDLTVPVTPGTYDLRFLAQGPEGARVMVARPVTVTPAEATLRAPDRVEAGMLYRVGWTGPFHPGHYITLTAPDAEAENYAYGYFYLPGPGLPGELMAPEEPGIYELRFILYTQGTQVLTRRALEVVPAGSLPQEAPKPDAPEAPGATDPAPLPDRGSLMPDPATALAQLCPAGGSPCAITDPATGLQVTLAPGFGITEPYIYETPGGARAARASFDLVRLADGATVVWVNPRQADPSSCFDTGTDQLCLSEAPGPDEQGALTLLLASLAAAVPAPAPEPEPAEAAPDLAGVWTLRIWQDGHPRNEVTLAVVELGASDAEGRVSGTFRSAPDFAGYERLSGDAAISFDPDGRMRLQLTAEGGAALAMQAEAFSPYDWVGQIANPEPGTAGTLGVALSRIAAPGEDWNGPGWMRGEADGAQSAMDMALRTLLDGLSEASPEATPQDRAALDMIGQIAGALTGSGLAAPAAPVAAPSPQLQALGGVLMEGIDADEALILLVPHLEVTR